MEQHSERHLELYDQMAKSAEIFGTSLLTQLKVPALVITPRQEITSMVPLRTFKGLTKLGEGSSVVYLKIGEKLVELGKATLSISLWRNINKLLLSYEPDVYELDEAYIVSKIDEDRIAELVFT